MVYEYLVVNWSSELEKQLKIEKYDLFQEQIKIKIKILIYKNIVWINVTFEQNVLLKKR